MFKIDTKKFRDGEGENRKLGEKIPPSFFDKIWGIKCLRRVLGIKGLDLGWKMSGK